MRDQQKRFRGNRNTSGLHLALCLTALVIVCGPPARVPEGATKIVPKHLQFVLFRPPSFRVKTRPAHPAGPPMGGIDEDSCPSSTGMLSLFCPPPAMPTGNFPCCSAVGNPSAIPKRPYIGCNGPLLVQVLLPPGELGHKRHMDGHIPIAHGTMVLQ
jgi:hypothetical protein